MACGLHHFSRYGRDSGIGQQNILYLFHEPLKHANIASRNANNGRNGLLVRKLFGRGLDPMAPPLIEIKLGFPLTKCLIKAK